MRVKHILEGIKQISRNINLFTLIFWHQNKKKQISGISAALLDVDGMFLTIICPAIAHHEHPSLNGTNCQQYC